MSVPPTPSSNTDEDSRSALAERLLVLIEALEAALARQQHSELSMLSFNQIQMLVLIRNQPGISQREIAARLDITPASVSVAASKLQRLGFIERQVDPQDNRAHALTLAAHAQDLARQYHEKRTGWLSEVLAQISAEEGQAAVDALERALTTHQRSGSGG